MSTETQLERMQEAVATHGARLSALEKHIGDSESGLTGTVGELKQYLDRLDQRLFHITIIIVVGITLGLGKEGIVHLLHF